MLSCICPSAAEKKQLSDQTKISIEKCEIFPNLVSSEELNETMAQFSSGHESKSY